MSIGMIKNFTLLPSTAPRPPLTLCLPRQKIFFSFLLQSFNESEQLLLAPEYINQ